MIRTISNELIAHFGTGMKTYIKPEAPPPFLLCPTIEGTICSECGCGNQPPVHCMYCLRDLSEEMIAELEAYREKCGPQPYVSTEADGYYLVWDGEHGPYTTIEDAIAALQTND